MMDDSNSEANNSCHMPSGNFKDILSQWHQKVVQEDAHASTNKSHIAGHAFRKDGAANLRKSINDQKKQQRCSMSSSSSCKDDSPLPSSSHSRRQCPNPDKNDPLRHTTPNLATPVAIDLISSVQETDETETEESTVPVKEEETEVLTTSSSSPRKSALAGKIGMFNKISTPPFGVKKSKSPSIATTKTTTPSKTFDASNTTDDEQDTALSETTTTNNDKVVSATKTAVPTNPVAAQEDNPSADSTTTTNNNNNTKHRWGKLKTIGLMAQATVRMGGHRMPKNIYQKPLHTRPDFVPPKFNRTNDELAVIAKALKKNFVFSDLQDKELQPLMGAFEKCHFSAKETIISQGDKGDYFYIIYDGKVVFDVDGTVVGKAGKGNSFGELALLYTCPRAASVFAHKNATLFRVDQATFRFILQNQTKNSEQEKKDLLENIDFFAKLNSYDLERLAQVMTPFVFTPDDVLVKKGDNGDRMFILQEGEVEVTDISIGSVNYADQQLGPGQWFGERSIIHSEPRSANIVALSYGVAFTIDREPFQKVLGDISKLVSKAQDTRTLAAVPLLHSANLTMKQYGAMAQAMVEKSFKANETVFKRGDLTAPALYFVREGEVEVKIKGLKEPKQILPGGFFGEEMMKMGVKHHLPSVPSPITVTCTQKTKLAELRLTKLRSIFDVELMCGRSSEAFSLGEIEEDSDDEEDAFVQLIKAKHELAVEFMPPIRPKVKMEDLEKIKLLGAGTFGQVWLVTDKTEKKKEKAIYALKVQTKYDLVCEGQVDAVIQERNIMSKIFHPFIVDFVASFQDDKFIFMVVHVIQGGELFSRVHDENADKDGLPDNQVKFYALCVADALAYLHRQGYVYRDLKTENVMIDTHGYPKLIDFGFAKHITEKTFTLCGTPGYLPPEIAMTRGHDWSADHWSLGILIYYMITGRNPFYYEGMDQMKLFQSIVEDDYDEPEGASEGAKNMIAGLLVKEPLQRLGSLSGGEQDILDHSWFKDLDLAAMRRKTVKAPWVPGLKDPLDTACFDDWDHLVDKMAEDLPVLKPKEAALFEKF